MQYDERRELSRYIWEYYRRLMTDFEQRVGLAADAEEYAAIGKSGVAAFMMKRHGLIGDTAVQGALADGVAAFRQRVCQRLLLEHPHEVFVNRCPRCRSVVRTPKARCGHDWHAESGES